LWLGLTPTTARWQREARFSDSGIAAIITTDIATDGTLAGPNLDALREMAQASSVPVIASGGIGCMADLLSLLPLEDLGVNGVIVGRALYDGRIDLAEAIGAIGDDRLQDITCGSTDLA
jgi:phosphoribosylformimino-5-aminoimidazole carboxamide ribotide isomerase